MGFMSPEIPETIYDVTETINGVAVIIKKCKSSASTVDANISAEIDLFDEENLLMWTKRFKGRLSSTVAQIKTLFRQPVDIFLCDEKKVCVLEDSYQPYLECYEIRDGVLNSSPTKFVKAKLKSIAFKYLINEVGTIRNVRKLIISNQMIPTIHLDVFRYLRYVKLINNGLVTVYPPKKMLEFCDMRGNFLKECNVRSKVLILQNNMIERFKSAQRFRYLNLSENPLKSLACNCEFLNIRNTFVSAIDSNAKVILADGVEKIRIGRCPNLRILYANNCQLTHIGNAVRNLVLFKGRNNYFQSLPRLNNGKVIDVAGNFLEGMGAQSVQFLNISKNQVRQIDMKRFPAIQHINLSFNPLEKVYSEAAIRQPKSLVINDSIHSSFSLLVPKFVKHHDCQRTNHYVTQYKLKGTVILTPISIFILVKSRHKPIHPDIFSVSFNKFNHMYMFFDMFSALSDHFYKKVSAIDQEATIAVTFITDSYVFIRSFYLPIFFSNFSEMDLLVDPNSIRVFNNVSNWCVFPVFCRYGSLTTKRTYSFFRSRADYADLFQFNNFSCATALEFFISNNAEFFTRSQVHVSCEVIKKVYLKTYCGNFEKKLHEIMSTQCVAEEEILGVKNINFNIARSSVESNLANITTRNPVFLYMKLYFESKSSHILKIEELNILHIVEFYAQIFEGRMVEKNYTLFIIGFNDPLHSALFGLRIHKVLKSVGIEVGIGIAGEAVFRTEQDGIVYFGGPVFNKASRIADLGTGVFCCRCVKFSSPLIEMFDEGERYLKGFNRRHRIFSLKLVHEDENNTV